MHTYVHIRTPTYTYAHTHQITQDNPEPPLGFTIAIYSHARASPCRLKQGLPGDGIAKLRASSDKFGHYYCCRGYCRESSGIYGRNNCCLGDMKRNVSERNHVNRLACVLCNGMVHRVNGRRTTKCTVW